MPYLATSNDAELIIAGTVKWFDTAKGFGFIEPAEGGPDVLLHANVLRNFGVNSVSEGSQVEVSVRHSDQGVQASDVRSITPPASSVDGAPSTSLNDLDMSELVPARIKWFCTTKCYGFANAYGHSDDIFIGSSVLRDCGLAGVQDGEAVSLRIEQSEKGKIASHVMSWRAGEQNVSVPEVAMPCATKASDSHSGLNI